MTDRIRRRYVALPHGQVHLAEAGPDGGRPVVLLHQTPRSVDEYRDVLPLLARAGLHAVAVDTPGFGASDPLPAEPGVEELAAAIGDAVAALGPAVLVGHHTGGVLAVELAATRPQQVAGLVLSSTPLVDGAFRTRPAHGVDDVEPADDGAHLLALWRGRASFYPPGRRDLLERFVRDALTAGELAHAGHALVRRYVMEEKLPAVAAPVLLVAAPGDPFGSPNTARMAEALPAAGLPRPEVVEIPGGTVPLPDQCPDEYAAAVVRFAAGLP